MRKYYAGAFTAIWAGVVFLGLTACSGQKIEEQGVDEKVHTAHTSTEQTVRLDAREILPFNPLQRQHVLEEMRQLLGASQGVIAGLANEDMAAVQSAASAVGMQALHTVENQENMKRLKMRQTAPAEFMALGMSVHRAFDDIAKMAADGKPARDIQLKLVDTMNACVACHAAYQIPNP